MLRTCTHTKYLTSEMGTAWNLSLQSDSRQIGEPRSPTCQLTRCACRIRSFSYVLYEYSEDIQLCSPAAGDYAVPPRSSPWRLPFCWNASSSSADGRMGWCARRGTHGHGCGQADARCAGQNVEIQLQTTGVWSIHRRRAPRSNLPPTSPLAHSVCPQQLPGEACISSQLRNSRWKAR